MVARIQDEDNKYYLYKGLFTLNYLLFCWQCSKLKMIMQKSIKKLVYIIKYNKKEI